MTDTHMSRVLGKIEQHLESMILHLDAAYDEATPMLVAEFDAIFGSVTGTGLGKRDAAANHIHAMLRVVRKQLAKLGAIEVK